jgi:hypothetical protein
MDEQLNWMVTHPGAGIEALELHLRNVFPRYADAPKTTTDR